MSDPGILRSAEEQEELEAVARAEPPALLAVTLDQPEPLELAAWNQSPLRQYLLTALPPPSAGPGVEPTSTPDVLALASAVMQTQPLLVVGLVPQDAATNTPEVSMLGVVEQGLPLNVSGAVKPFGAIVFNSEGADFAPLLAVASDSFVEWTFADGTTSNAPSPSKSYGSVASRRNVVRVTPWAKLSQVNLGYDASDGGSVLLTQHPTQNVSRIDGLDLAKDSLVDLMASYCPITSIDLRGFSVLDTIEFFHAALANVNITNMPALQRVCLEANSLATLDLSGSSNIADLRAAVQVGELDSVVFPASRDHIWHVCVRDNGPLAQLPSPMTFPAIREWWTWGSQQTGAISFPASIESIICDWNFHTGATIAGTPILVSFLENSFDQAAVDSVLAQMVAAGHSNGTLDLHGVGMAAPSAAGVANAATLTGRGWTVTTN